MLTLSVLKGDAYLRIAVAPPGAPPSLTAEEQLAAAIRTGDVERVRFAAHDRVPGLVRAAAAEAFVHLADTPVLAEGRIELLWYLREQSISDDYHRYGNLGARSEERRAEPL